MGSEILLSAAAAGGGHGSRDVVMLCMMLLGCLLVLGFSQSQNIIDTSSNGVPLAVALNSY